MPVIPNTGIRMNFISPTGQYPSLFYGAMETGPALASLNAGNSDALYVGGGGINYGFGSLLAGADTGQDTGAYQQLHQGLLRKADDASAADAFEAYSSGDPMAFSYVRSARVTSKAGWYDGVAFMDVFSSAHRPHRNASNAAMLYLAPPKATNYQDEAAFLQAITGAAENVAATVAGYNAIAGQQQQPVIEALRLCLFSSSIYNQKDDGTNLSSPHRIARAIYAGLCAALSKTDSGLKELQLPVPADPLFSAVEAAVIG